VGWPGARPSFFEGRDSTVVSRVRFLADSCSALVHRVNDDPHHPPVLLRSALPRSPVHGENSLTRSGYGEERRGPSTPRGLHFVKFTLRSG